MGNDVKVPIGTKYTPRAGVSRQEQRTLDGAYAHYRAAPAANDHDISSIDDLRRIARRRGARNRLATLCVDIVWGAVGVVCTGIALFLILSF